MNNQGRRNCGSKSQKNKESFDMIVREVNAEFSRITKRSINDLERLAEQSTDNTMKKVTMTENEAKVFIQNAMEQSKKALAELLLIGPKVFAGRKKTLGEFYSNVENCKTEIESCEVAIRALEDVQKYRALGMPEEISRKLKELEKISGSAISATVRKGAGKMNVDK